MGGSRQTKIRVVKEMIDHGLICVSSVEAHNKQYLVNTDYGMRFLSMDEASRSPNFKIAYQTESAPMSISFKTEDSKMIHDFKTSLNSANTLIDTKPIDFGLIHTALETAKSTLMEIQYGPAEKRYSINDSSMLTPDSAKDTIPAEDRIQINDPSMLTGSANSDDDTNAADEIVNLMQTVKH